MEFAVREHLVPFFVRAEHCKELELEAPGEYKLALELEEVFCVVAVFFFTEEHTPHFPPALQCLQEEQDEHAEHGELPVQRPSLDAKSRSFFMEESAIGKESRKVIKKTKGFMFGGLIYM